MPTALARRSAGLPSFVPPQLCRLRQTPPSGDRWVHEIKYDGYRIHARIDAASVKLLTRTGLDWTDRYPATAAALNNLPARRAYIDGELCALNPDGTTSFAAMQAATDSANTGDLVYYAFDLLHLDGEDLARWPLIERKDKLEALLAGADARLRYSEHIVGHGADVLLEACRLGAEGIVSKQIDRAYAPDDRGIWIKAKCLKRQEFVAVGWTEPKGGRQGIGALLLGYYDADGRLLYAGRVGTGMTDQELTDLAARLKPLAVDKMPLAVPPPRETRFGSRLELSRVHWVRPALVVEVTYSTWTDDGLLRQVVYQRVREDKPASEG
ncbi:bifunctional non-homologous end joining protein LigD [Rhizobiales bacterium GAS191]|nr:bifunctional non-homologous end joining protein LigD [Rhizobiales bacterium GAS113]SEC56284.1 bifunctional non-homologous end joining protein LigD [Rhizobiales bacterium GAS191]